MTFVSATGQYFLWPQWWIRSLCAMCILTNAVPFLEIFVVNRLASVQLHKMPISQSITLDVLTWFILFFYNFLLYFLPFSTHLLRNVQSCESVFAPAMCIYTLYIHFTFYYALRPLKQTHISWLSVMVVTYFLSRRTPSPFSSLFLSYTRTIIWTSSLNRVVCVCVTTK